MEWCVVTLIENSNIYQDFYLFGEFFKYICLTIFITNLSTNEQSYS